MSITLKPGDTSGSCDVGPYRWKGEDKPTFEIEELPTKDSEKYGGVNITPKSGVLIEDGTVETEVKTIISNTPTDREAETGKIVLKKELKERQVTDQEFAFYIKVTGVIGTDNKDYIEDTRTLKAGDAPIEIPFQWWKDAELPRFEIIENPNNEVKDVKIEVTGADDVQIDEVAKKVTGQVKRDETTGEIVTINVDYENEMKEPHIGNIKVKKEFFSNEKLTQEDLKNLAKEHNITFDYEVVITGTFEYGGKQYNNESCPIKGTLSAAGNWQDEITGIKWWGDVVPTYTIKETRIPSDKWGWKCLGVNWTNEENNSTGSEGHELVVDGTDEVTITNIIPSGEEKELTFEMAGLVWVDQMIDSKDNLSQDGYRNTNSNGVYDEGIDLLKENVKVEVYKIKYKADGTQHEALAKAYKDISNTPLDLNDLYTGANGKWEIPRIQLPGLTKADKEAGYVSADYDVRFIYDGETYEPAEFLSYKVSKDRNEKLTGENSVKAKKYREEDNIVDQRKYFRDSMAVETQNNAKKITEVSGKTAIDENGNTTGVVKIDGKDYEVQYASSDRGKEYPIHSTLQTTDENGKPFEPFKAIATTKTGGLTYPFTGKGCIGNIIEDEPEETTFTVENGFLHKLSFFATYDHCVNINLGLKVRDELDIGLTKNLDNAKVIVNEKMYQYNYSGYYDLTEEKTDSLSKAICVESKEQDLSYTLGLYRSDYYYRAEMYKKENSNVYEALESFYANKGGVKSTELDIYLTYKIKLKNASNYKVRINSLDDYYDSSFELVKGDETKYLKTKTVGGTETSVNSLEKVAGKTYHKNGDSIEEDNWNWTTSKKDIVSLPENKTYNKMTATELNINLGPNDEQEFYITFKVGKGPDNEYKIEDSIKLGLKCNVAEIASYSVTDQGNAKIDRDSAPGNVNIENHNEKSWYEDDTFAAPKINIDLINQNVDRKIQGVVWEDDSTKNNTKKPDSRYNQTIGDGVKQNNEQAIEGLTTELVQKVTVQNKNADNTWAATYTEYDYIWPTGEGLECLNGNTMEKVFGLDTTIETKADGSYNFQGVIAGDYVVRFTYGDERDYKADTVTDYKIGTAEYSEAEYYNGQDFKSSKFNGKLLIGDKLQADSYLKFDEYINKEQALNNTAVDSEVRRLEVINKSREITNRNSTIMHHYEDELFKEYYMWADTPKIDMNVEPSLDFSNNEGTSGNMTNEKKGVITYNVNNINFALEERPITQLTLDKQIEEIIITSSDGNKIMDAKYNITYEVDGDGKIKANVELIKESSYGIDKLQALNRDEATDQGFRYINADSSILQGTKITVKYKFTVLNTGEVDRTGKLDRMLYKEDTLEFEEACTALSNKLATKYTKRSETGKLENSALLGEYVGTIYYYGTDKKLFNYDENGEKDEDYIVTSRVRQLVDYVDNDVVFDGTLNASANMSWGTTTVEELEDHIANGIIQGAKILDHKGISYTTEGRNNLILSVDYSSANGENDETETLNNSEFIKNIQPYNAWFKQDGASNSNVTNYQASMNLTLTRSIGVDSDDLQIDNIAEIIRYNNKVGRRDNLTIAGNTNPSELLGKVPSGDAVNHSREYERDTSATEVITLSPPTGSSVMVWRLQVAAAITAGLAIMAGGIICIKKKILK